MSSYSISTAEMETALVCTFLGIAGQAERLRQTTVQDIIDHYPEDRAQETAERLTRWQTLYWEDVAKVLGYRERLLDPATASSDTATELENWIEYSRETVIVVNKC